MPKKIDFNECQKRLDEKYPDEPIKLIKYDKIYNYIYCSYFSYLKCL